MPPAPKKLTVMASVVEPGVANPPHPPPHPPTAEPAFLSLLNSGEREYVRGMKRKERGDLGKILVNPRAKTVPLRIKVLQSQLPEALKMQMFHELSHSVNDKYLQWCLKMLRMPLGVYHRPSVSSVGIPSALKQAKEVMDASIIGQDVAKREVLKLVQQSIQNPLECATSYALGLEGKPGCGKTQFVRRAMAAALGRPVISIPLGGASDGSSFLWGHNYSYEGSKEGRLAGGLMEVGCCNPIVHFDEVDKVFERDRGGAEIISSLIHLVDPSSNAQLRDRYLHGLDIDFSKCIFVFSYNHPEKINPVLMNRIKRIAFDVPTKEQKKAIVTEQILPRVQQRLGTKITLKDEVVELLLEVTSGDEGLRDLEKSVDHVVACANLQQCMRGETCTEVTLGEVREGLSEMAKTSDPSPPPPHMYS